MRRPNLPLVLGLVAAVTVAAACAAGDDGPDGRASSDPAPATSAPFAPGPAPTDGSAADIAALLDDQGFEGEPGCAVGAARDGDTVFVGGAGVADLDTGEPITAETTFDVASVTKQFTAAAVLSLVEEGRLSLDDDVRRHVPELPDYGVTVTVEHLLHHTGGLVEYTDLLAEDHDDTDRTTTAQALAAIAAEPELEFDPGSEFEYSNTGYFLLGLVAARVAGESLDRLLDAELFTPLGMDASVLRDDADLDVALGAEGYVVDAAGRFVPATTGWEQVGDGALWTSAADLLRWAENLHTFDVGGAALGRAMRTPGAVPDVDGSAYGGGLSLTDGRLEHSGAWAGFVSDLVVDLDEGTSVVALCNRDDGDAYGLAEDVLALL